MSGAQHGCRFDWCTNGAGTIGVGLEHMSVTYSVPATADIRLGCMELPIVDVSLWFQEDLELAADIQLSISGGPTADLRIEEAVLLVDNLNQLIAAAAAGTQFDPDRIIRDYHGRGH